MRNSIGRNIPSAMIQSPAAATIPHPADGFHGIALADLDSVPGRCAHTTHIRSGRRNRNDHFCSSSRSQTTSRTCPPHSPPSLSPGALGASGIASRAKHSILASRRPASQPLLRDQRVSPGVSRCPTPAIVDSQTVPDADTVHRSGHGWGRKLTNDHKRHTGRGRQRSAACGGRRHRLHPGP